MSRYSTFLPSAVTYFFIEKLCAIALLQELPYTKINWLNRDPIGTKNSYPGQYCLPSYRRPAANSTRPKRDSDALVVES